jgi:hypothetical protein
MMRRWLTSIVLAGVLGLGVVVAMSGCGSQKRTIPTKTAQSMLAQLDKITSQYDNGACNGTKAKVDSLAAQARNLPNSVDSEVKQNLVDGIARLRTLVQTCKPAQPTTTTPTTVPSVPTVTNTVPTAPTQSTPTTVPTAPTTTPTAPTTTPTTPGGGTTVPGTGGGVTVPGTIGGGTP